MNCCRRDKIIHNCILKHRHGVISYDETETEVADGTTQTLLEIPSIQSANKPVPDADSSLNGEGHNELYKNGSGITNPRETPCISYIRTTQTLSNICVLKSEDRSILLFYLFLSVKHW